MVWNDASDAAAPQPVAQSTKVAPFIDYYTQLGFVPTRQEGDTTSLFRRREELYLRLGLPPALFRGAEILEFGPGSGENASFTASLGPKRFHIVDAVESALAATQEAISKVTNLDSCRFSLTTIEDFSDNDVYDIVLCEGLLPFQDAPVKLVKKIAEFVRPGGVLVVTCADAISMLPESLRRYSARRMLATRQQFSSEFVADMVLFFEQDLDALPGMTRNRHDWVVDQLLHPWTGRTFSMGDALKALDQEFRPTGASPSIFADWRWYKDYESVNADWVGECQKLFNQANGRFVERRSLIPELSPLSMSTLRRVAEFCYDLTCEGSGCDRDSDALLISHLDELLDQVPELPPHTQRAVMGFQRYLQSDDPLELADFRPWWGRGQQYLALTRTLR